MIPLIKQTLIKNESSSILQKLVDYLIEKKMITKEEILEFLNDKPQNVYATISSYLKESYCFGLPSHYEDSTLKLKKKNSGLLKHHCLNSSKKIKKMGTNEGGFFSSYSNNSGVLFDEISSLDLDTIKHDGESHGLGKIDEGNSNYNSSSLKNMKIEKESFFIENFHETYG